jgi:hypothetical protein
MGCDVNDAHPTFQLHAGTLSFVSAVNVPAALGPEYIEDERPMVIVRSLETPAVQGSSVL